MNKICIGCNNTKNIAEFHRHSGKRDGYSDYCKVCKSKQAKISRVKNYSKLSQQSKEYYLRNKELIKAKTAKYYQANKEKCINQQKEYYLKNKLTIQIRKREWTKKHSEDKKIYDRQRVQRLKKKINEWHKEYNRKQRKNNVSFAILASLRSRLTHALNGKDKSKRTVELLGCSVNQLKQHLEIQFKEGMTWSNYGLKGWHIDHIKPCASFDLSKPEEQAKCFHYTNLQPLWAEENILKSDKF